MRLSRRSKHARSERLPPHACWTCAYTLADLQDEVCPECGTPVAWSRYNYALARLPDRERRRALIALRCITWGPILLLISVLLLVIVASWSAEELVRLPFVIGGAIAFAALASFTMGLWLCRWLWADAPEQVDTPIDSRLGAVGFAVAASVLSFQHSFHSTVPQVMPYALLAIAVVGTLMAGSTALSAVHFAAQRHDPGVRQHTRIGKWLFTVGVIWMVISVNGWMPRETLPTWLRACLSLISLAAVLMPLALASQAGELVKTLRRTNSQPRATPRKRA